MPTNLVADASVVVPWLKSGSESFSEKSLKLFEDFLADKVRITVPQLFFLEVSNVVVLSCKNEGFPEELLDRFHKLDFIHYELKPWDYVDVARVAHEKKITVYDAAYYHVAEILNLPLYTADEKLLQAWGSKPGGHIRQYRLS